MSVLNYKPLNNNTLSHLQQGHNLAQKKLLQSNNSFTTAISQRFFGLSLLNQ